MRNELEFLRIIEKVPEYDRFVITGKDYLGYLLFRCTKLNELQKCSCYDERLHICKNFPDKTLFFTGGRLPKNCGYTMKTGPSFKKIIGKEMRR